MSNRINSKNPNHTNTNNNGLAERDITGDDMNAFKNAMDHQRSYVSGTTGRSSTSHQFTEKHKDQK